MGSPAGEIDSDVTRAQHTAASARGAGSIRSFPVLLQTPLVALAVDASRMEA
jgi:hypothetical protein